MKLLDDGGASSRLIDRMVPIAQQDAPWSFGYFPYAGSVQHQSWVHNCQARRC